MWNVAYYILIFFSHSPLSACYDTRISRYSFLTLDSYQELW